MHMAGLSVALYARLSKDRSGLSENVNIQLREGRYYVEDNGGTARKELEFHDNDISASKFSKKPRKDYVRLLAAIERGEVEVIVVTEIPRLYRRLEELLELIKMAERTNLRGIWTTDGIGYDLSTPEGIHAAIAAVNNAMLESNRLSKRQKRKKKARAEQGRYIGGQRRYGFEGALKDEHGNILNRGRINKAVIEDEKKVWIDNARRIIAGERPSSIIKDHNNRGIPAPMGGKWTIGNFKRLMTNEAYVIFENYADHPKVDGNDCPCLNNPETGGTLVHHGIRHRAEWPGFITRAEHELMLARFKEWAQSWVHGPVKGRTYLLSGIIYCGGSHNGGPCNGAMYGNGRMMSNGVYQRRYHCKRNNNHLEVVACGKVFRGAEPLDLLVSEIVLDYLDTPEVARGLASAEDGERIEELMRKLATQKAHRMLIKKRYARNEITFEDWKEMRDEADAFIAEMEDELTRLQAASIGDSLPIGDKLREAWARMPVDTRRAVIRLVVDKVIVKPSKPGMAMWNGYRFKPDDVTIVLKKFGRPVDTILEDPTHKVEIAV